MDVVTFLKHYGFDLERQAPSQWIERWLVRFPPDWIPLAELEALFQGRYKANSVDHLLHLWARRGYPRLGFTSDFCQRIWPDQLDLFTFALSQDHRQDWGIPLAWEDPWDPQPDISSHPLLDQLQTQSLSPKLRQLLESEVAALLQQSPRPEP